MVVLKMLYQLFKIPEDIRELFCVPVSCLVFFLGSFLIRIFFAKLFINFFTIQDEYALTFSSLTFCDVKSTAHWLGINKSNDEESSFIFLGHYLGFILSATTLSTVLFYQARKR